MFCLAGLTEYDADLETVHESGPARPKKRKFSKEAAEGPSRGRKKHGMYTG